MIRVMMASGKEADAPVDDLCGRQLSNGALVKRNADGVWVATEAAAQWLETSDDMALAEHLHNNVKLFGELLSEVEGVRTKDDALRIAHAFSLHWTSTDQLYRRLGWMEVLGLLERWGSNKFVITEQGHDFLSRVQLVSSDQVAGTREQSEEDVEPTLTPASPIVAGLVARSDKQRAARKAIIGYIPRGRKAPDRESDAGSQSPFDAIRNLMDLLGEGASVDEFQRRCVTQMGMKMSSASQTLQTMRNMRVFDMVAYNQYGVDSEVAELLELGNEVDFVRFLHSRYLFVGELLRVIVEPTPVPEVAKIAVNRFGYRQIDNAEVRTRLGFMTDAGLAERLDWTRYKATALGMLLAEELDLQEPSDVVTDELGSEPVPEEDTQETLSGLISALQEFANRSDAADQFEAAVAAAFAYLGFDAKHLGGSGLTDVVVEAHLPDKDGYRAIIDAKASASGVVGDNSINFDTLKGHRKKHHADYGMVVGPEFSARVRGWARDNDFVAMAVDELCAILSRHQVNPLTLPELRALFDRRAASDDMTDIELQYTSGERSTELLTKLVELLYIEAREDDPILDGYISLENVNYVLRKELSPRPSTAAIEDCLSFLSHDLVRAVVKSGSKYKLADAPSNIMKRLAGLGRRLDQISIVDS